MKTLRGLWERVKWIRSQRLGLIRLRGELSSVTDIIGHFKWYLEMILALDFFIENPFGSNFVLPMTTPVSTPFVPFRLVNGDMSTPVCRPDGHRHRNVRMSSICTNCTIAQKFTVWEASAGDHFLVHRQGLGCSSSIRGGTISGMRTLIDLKIDGVKLFYSSRLS